MRSNILGMYSICSVILFCCLALIEANTYQKTPVRPFAVANPGQIPSLIGASAQIVLRLGTGALTNGYSISLAKESEVEPAPLYCPVKVRGLYMKESCKLGPRPKEPIIMYEFEGCPYCKKVREVITLLDLEVLFYPCPKGGPTYRLKAKALGGKTQFPYMVDPNTGTSMYESSDIIEYLYSNYGPQEDGESKRVSANMLALSLSSLFRAGKGTRYEETAAPTPKKPLIYWGYEVSPFCKIVRERLVELELPHIQKTCGRGSSRRNELVEKTGRFQVPYLEDPNTGVNLFESSDIIDYLNDKYVKKSQDLALKKT